LQTGYETLLFEQELTKANTEGITFVNSSGDTGAAECDSNGTDHD
jgi:subtilase family serine protease